MQALPWHARPRAKCAWAQARQAGTACVITVTVMPHCEAAGGAAISAAVELNDAAAGPAAGPCKILSRDASPRH